MGVKLESLFGSPSLGVYMVANNEFLLIPKNVQDDKIRSLKSAFPDNFPIYKFMVNQSALLGSYIVSNSNGILLPSLILEEELEELKLITKEDHKNIGVLSTKDNALGNLILCNNHGAIITKTLTKNIKKIQNVLDVEVLVLDYAENKLPGSSGIANNNGCCVHPMVTDEEAKMIADILKVPVDVSTINMGNPFIRSGAIVNDSGGIFGVNSSGPELMRLTMLLNL
jgi:translation initiation factor 6